MVSKGTLHFTYIPKEQIKQTKTKTKKDEIKKKVI